MDREREEVIAIVSPSMMSHPQSIREASQAPPPSQFGHNVDLFKFVFKKTPKSDKERRVKKLAPRLVDEPSTEPQSGLKDEDKGLDNPKPNKKNTPSRPENAFGQKDEENVKKDSKSN
ncbi:hypothetical protein SUGI_1150600 [Cryptomeria japonica]|nr:hypothetical protein SUGI_1150600 [Cryptomeria japonica]